MYKPKENLLYSAENSTQCRKQNSSQWGDLNGEESQGRADIHKCTADSVCCIAEINPILNSNTVIKKKISVVKHKQVQDYSKIKIKMTSYWPLPGVTTEGKPGGIS